MTLQSSIGIGVRASVATVLLLAVACEKPIVAQGNTATVGGIEFTVAEHEVRYLEVAENDNTYEYPQPAVLIGVTLKNVGEGSFTYSPTHSTQQSSEAQTPMLYHAPTGEDADDLPPKSKKLINGVMLSKGSLGGQITKSETIEKGASISDVLLFEVPATGGPLILSLPPAMHRGKFPVLFKLDFQPTAAKGPKMYAVGEPVAFGTTTFTVVGSEILYLKTRDTLQGEGFSSEPLLKISYEIENNGTAPVSYDPAHRSVGGRGASLYGKDTTFKRVKFASSTTVDGQRDGTTTIAPGDKLSDFVLFDRPSEGTSELTFEYPAPLFGGSGLARYVLEYEYSNPAPPKELKLPKPAPAKGG